METCPVYSFCSFKGMYSVSTYANPKRSLFCLLVYCYGIGDKYFKY